jgi:hypothetical protein
MWMMTLRAPSMMVVEGLFGHFLVALVDHFPEYLEYMSKCFDKFMLCFISVFNSVLDNDYYYYYCYYFFIVWSTLYRLC